MPTLTRADAERIAERWLAAFNAHRADLVVAEFAQDVEIRTPMLSRLRPDSAGQLRGRAAVQDYYEEGLRSSPDLCFTLVEVLTGVDQLSILYRNHHERLVAETLTLDAAGAVHRVDVTYGRDVST